MAPWHRMTLCRAAWGPVGEVMFAIPAVTIALYPVTRGVAAAFSVFDEYGCTISAGSVVLEFKDIEYFVGWVGGAGSTAINTQFCHDWIKGSSGSSSFPGESRNQGE